MIKKLYHRLLHGNTNELDIPTRKNIRNTKADIFNVFSLDIVKNQEEENIHGLSKKEVTAILQDMLISDKITDGSFLYAWNNYDAKGIENWSSKFSAVAHTPLYQESINENEKTLYDDITLDTIIAEMSKNKKVHVELGPESGEKFIQYSDNWDPEHIHLTGKKYIGIDVSGVYVDMANKNVEKIGMICESVPGDWFKHSIFDTEKDQIYYFFGGSVGNLDVWLSWEVYPQKDKKTILNLLKRMQSNQPLSSVPVVITYFEPPDKADPQYQDKVDKLEATYWSKDNPKYYDKKTHEAIADFILSGFEALGLERSKLELAVEYNDTTTPAMIKVGATCIENMEIQVEGYTVLKKKGQKIRAIKSQRFSKEAFQEISHDAGFSMKYQKSRNGVAVAVLQSKIGFNDRFKKARNIGYWLLIWATLLGWWLFTKTILHQKKIEKQQEQIDNDFASKQKMVFYWADHGYYELTTDKEKIEYINTLTSKVFENISIRYHIQKDEDEIKRIIRSYIKDQEILSKFANTTNYSHNIFDISDDFVRKYSDVLVEKDINNMPYDHLQNFEEYFKDVILDTTILDEATVKLYRGEGGVETEEIYLIHPMNDNSMYFNIQLQCIKNWTKKVLEEDKLFQVENEKDPHIKNLIYGSNDVVDHYVKDGYLYIKRWKEHRYSYIVASAQSEKGRNDIDPHVIAYDYFYQNNPVIHETYKRFSVIYWGTSWNHNWEKETSYRWQKDVIKMMIIKDMLQTWILDQLDGDNDTAMIAYLHEFAQRNTSALQKEWIAIVPYEMYQKQYSESCKNTAETSEDSMPKKIIYEERQKYDFNYIGKYYTQTGDMYDVAQISIEWKKYIFARNSNEEKHKEHTEEWLDIIPLNYYLLSWKEVVKDYFWFQNKI